MELAEFQRLEQVKAMYKQITPSLLILAIGVYTLSFIALWPVYDKTILLFWYISGVIITIMRKLSAMSFFKQEVTIESCQMWLNRAVLWAFLSGISWGFIYLFFTSPDHFFRLLILLGVYGALITLSGANFGVLFPVYFAFALPLTVLFFGKIIYIGGDIFYLAGALVVAYFIEMTSIALNTQHSFNKSSGLHFANEKLIGEVTTQKETAENAILEKNQFLAAASHDLRQPLHAQGLFINAIKDQSLSTDTHEIISKIQLSNEALNGLLNSLLDISRLDAESVDHTPEHIALSPIIKNIVEEYSDRAKQNNSKIIVILPDDLSVYCDEALLSRLIRNLVDNAIKFTNNGRVTISAKTHYNKVAIILSDTGKGIPKDQIKNIFTEFTQLDNPERDRQKGLGLGLAIVQRLSALMNIKVDIESEVDIGTTFTLQLPSSINSSIEIKKTGLKTSITKQTKNIFKDQTILVIDDEIEILDGMQYLVETWQANVITANDAEMALEKLRTLEIMPTLILADFRLRHNHNGIDAIEKIRMHFNQPINAILITGDTSPDRLKLAQSANLNILHKPVSPQLLCETASNIITNSEKNS